jgi:large subunit ribosomal protein L16
MLTPRKVKHRKWQKGRSRSRQVETRGTSLAFGTYGLQALEAKWVTARQLEAARRAMTRFVERGGKIWVRVFTDKPVTQRPPEVTMGGGKGAVSHYVFPVKPGRILFEMDGVAENVAHEALLLAAHKLPLKTKIIRRR